MDAVARPVAEILAQAEAEGWPTSAFSTPPNRELDDTRLTRPYVQQNPEVT